MLLDTSLDTIIGKPTPRLCLESRRTLQVQITGCLLSCCLWGEFFSDFDFFFFFGLITPFALK